MPGSTPKEAARRFYLVDKDGLLVEGMGEIEPFQRRFVQSRAAVVRLDARQPDRISLLDVIRNAKPTVLIGVSGQPGAFSERWCAPWPSIIERPIIFPLSNPISRAEATPADIERWSEGRAIIGAGSPFPPLKRAGRRSSVDQTNNSYIFPGIGLGVIATHAPHHRRDVHGRRQSAGRAVAGPA